MLRFHFSTSAMTLRQLYHNTFAPFSTHKTTELCNDYRFLFSKSINSQSNPIKILLRSAKFVTLALVSTTLVATASMRFPLYLASSKMRYCIFLFVMCVCAVARQIKMQYAAWIARTFFFCGCRALGRCRTWKTKLRIIQLFSWNFAVLIFCYWIDINNMD